MYGIGYGYGYGYSGITGGSSPSPMSRLRSRQSNSTKKGGGQLLPTSLPIRASDVAPLSSAVTHGKTSPYYTTDVSSSKKTKPSRFKRFLNKAKTYMKKTVTLPLKYPTSTTIIGIVTVTACGLLNPGLAVALILTTAIVKIVSMTLKEINTDQRRDNQNAAGYYIERRL